MAAMALAVVGIGAFGALRWSLIPIHVDGRIERVDYYDDTGDHFRVLVFDDDRALVVDRELVRALGGRYRIEGQRLHKNGWDRAVSIDGHTAGLHPSAASWRVAATLVLLTAASSARRWRRTTTRSTARAAGSPG